MKKSFYNRMMPSFKEASNWVTDDNDVTCFNEIIAEFIWQNESQART